VGVIAVTAAAVCDLAELGESQQPRGHHHQCKQRNVNRIWVARAHQVARHGPPLGRWSHYPSWSEPCALNGGRGRHGGFMRIALRSQEVRKSERGREDVHERSLLRARRCTPRS